MRKPLSGGRESLQKWRKVIWSAWTGLAHPDLLLTSLTDPDPLIRDAGVEALGALGDARAFEAVLSCLIDLDTLTKSVPTPVKRRLTLHPPNAASASQFRRVLVASMLAGQATRPGTVARVRLTLGH